MLNIFESISKRLMEAWKSGETSDRRHSFSCRCGRPVYFRNSLCLGCNAPLGYEPERLQVRALVTGPQPGEWRTEPDDEAEPAWKRCENFDSPAGCNWLLRAD